MTKNNFKYLIILLFIFSCKKENNHLAEYIYGSASTIKNGDLVHFNKCSAGIDLQNNFGFSFSKWNGLTEIEGMDINNIKKNNLKQRVYKIDYANPTKQKPIVFFTTLTDDGDILCDNYYVFEADSVNNYIQVIKYDSSTRLIEGVFSLTLLRDQKEPKCRITASDTIRMRDGVFNTKVF